jgi:hypothetical protein
MKQKTFVLRNKTVISNLIAFIEAQPEIPVLEVIVREHKKKRNVLQNSLYWLWISVIADSLGMTKEDVHFDLRKRILLPIYERDNLEFSEMIVAVRKVYRSGAKEDAQMMIDFITKKASTTEATVKQFAEYLTEIERDMIGKGIILPHKEDLYYDSLVINPEK